VGNCWLIAIKMDKERKSITENIEIPDGISISVNNGVVSVKGKHGENSKNLSNKSVSIKVQDGKVVILAKKASKREKKVIGTFKAHIKNLIKAAGKGVIYKLKICSGHFPMNVSTEKNEFIIKNFLGEKIPRKIKIEEGVAVKVDGDIITVTSSNKELAGQFAASIEQLTRRTKYDTRIFMDGIWIIDNDGKEIK
jgi:large subunit ribosomal protein L6